ncbi:thiolase [Citrifermentans bemidjiense Bem]|uniref:Thiolase n=1 Tax=Citrifermentans bemidjiense (strain ATCC BAA-1014 / DSM 16622 / JCM 12645 / Bem) TaxID=404380 RepID=B5EID7_CITBB|nr:thiolase family protein [Citrifermentans bemidjiense]ACH39839.1 thiolase [Citrifermentans bemidjiense Bem]
MKDIFVVESQRTPFGSFGGVLSDVEATVLGGGAIKALLERTGLDPAEVDEVIAGQVLSGGCGQAPARQAMRGAGIPDSAHAMTINKVCGSGLKAIMLGAGSIQLEDSEIVVAGGMENMSLAPFLLKKARYGYRMGHGSLIDLMIYDGLQDPYSGRHMGEIAEASVKKHGLTREAQDEFTLRSYKLAQDAVRGGVFKDEIAPVVKKGRKGDEVISDDEEPFKVDFDKLTQLRPVFSKDGTITAANASSINDGAAFTLLAGESALKRCNLTPKARVVAYATGSLHPELYTEAPVTAIQAACARAGLKVGDIDLFEINEAFAAVTMIAMKELDLNPAKVNVNGGACALGHPIGASGARLAGTLIRELHKRQARYGLATLCIGGGEAVAVIFERV